MSQEYIKIRGARENNLKNIDIDIPHKKLIVITGLSGSGKSSLAFDIIYNEGQRRYVESMSSYVRQFLEMQSKPDVDSITGLAPAIAIDQKTTSKNPRSTVGTMTEIYDYFRLLFSRVGIPYSPKTGLPIKNQSLSEMINTILSLPENTKMLLLAPVARGEKGEFKKELLNLRKRGFEKVIIDGETYSLSDEINLDKNKKHTIEVIIDRLVINQDIRVRLSSSLESALKISDGIAYVEISEMPEGALNYKVSDKIVFSEKYSCPESGFQITEIEPRIFSFNTPFGACPKCQGLGTEMYFDREKIVSDYSLSINQGAIIPWSNSSKFLLQTLESLANHYGFSLNEPFVNLTDKVKDVIFYGSGEEKINFRYYDDSRDDSIKTTFGGVIMSLDEKMKKADSQSIKDELTKYMSECKCRVCLGHRLKAESLCIKIQQKHIGEICSMSIANIKDWVISIESNMREKEIFIAHRIIKEIKERLDFLINVGLNYLTLSRESGTLSGGESQRIRLASQIGSGLTGVLYVLDEPSIGLHQRDNIRLINTLKNLRDLGNTVLVVEHDEETILNADHVIDVGLGAGALGGNIIAQGTIEDIRNSKESITGQYLRREKSIEVREKLRAGHPNKFLEIKGARANNLKNVDLKIRLGTFTSIVGVSGGGKSSLIIHTLYKAVQKKLEPLFKAQPGAYDKLMGVEHIDKIIDIDQSPIGRTPRSNPATYTGTFNHIRDWFAELPEAKARGYGIGRFSFNVKGGRCEACQGDGLVKIEMHFLPDIYVECETCSGKRYNQETLDIKYKGKSISDVLNMTVKEALDFFKEIPLIYEKMCTFYDVGLGYIKIGQSATTLSGGEAQRIKLSKELSRRSTGKTLYILDEPTTGLHVDDISKLLKVLHKLVDMGNTVLVIEHNLDVIKTSDYVIDVGPEGGDLGGRIIAEGTPFEIMQNKNSVTGKYLLQYTS
jgi:excinuclease ABC subunit A